MMLCEKYKEQFLQPEVRYDTYIGIEIKQVWFAELQLLEKFIDVCNKHGLSYQLVGGSLLGAIRHKGFIPWDDDVDVGMLRPDYDRFVQLAKNELEAPFFLQTPLTDPGRNIDYVQIRNSATTAIDLRYVDDHNTFNQGIFIDIFPIDGVGSDEVLQKQEKQQQFIRRVYGSAFKTNATGKARIKHYVSNAIYKIAGPKNIDKKRNDIFRKVSIESSNEIGLVSFLFNNNRRNYWKKEWVLNCTNAPFEFLNVTVPIAADEVLTKTYGNWRMFEKGMAMHSGIDFDVSKSYMEVLRDKYHYEEFKSYNSQKGKNLITKLNGGGVLRPIAPNENQTIYDMLQGIDRRENDFTNDVKDMPYEEFPEWCKLQYEYANGRLLPAGYVPQSIYWLYIDGEPVGIGKIRWKLTETSREAGGNIGYAISRQYRGHGYGTILLKSLIDIAKSGNCPELLATVKKYNYASKRVMEKCSGELVRETDERWYYRLG